MEKRRTSSTWQRRTLRRLMRQGHGLCEFCGEVVKAICMIRRRDRIRQTAHLITYRTPKGEIVTRRIATVEHVQRLCDGGTNERQNLALACARCNQDRNVAHQTPPADRKCRRCGKPAGDRQRNRKHCDDCRHALVRVFKPEPTVQPIGPILQAALRRKPARHS